MEIYLIVIGKTSTGYSAHCPDVLGCATVGKTVEEVVVNMREALDLHFEGMAEDGDPIPRSGGIDSYREVIRGPGLGQVFPCPRASRYQPVWRIKHERAVSQPGCSRRPVAGLPGIRGNFATLPGL